VAAIAPALDHEQLAARLVEPPVDPLAPAPPGTDALAARVVEAPRDRVAPLSPGRFAVQFTLGQESYDELRYAQALLGHAVPSHDIAQVFERALRELVEKLERRKFAAAVRTRPGRRSKNPHYVPADIRRVVWQRIAVILILAGIGNVVFWTAFEQAGSSLNVFAKNATDRSLGGFFGAEGFPASWYQSVNPLAILVFAPVFAWLWVFLDRRGRDPSTPVKFAWGLFLLGFIPFVGPFLSLVWGARAVAMQMTDPALTRRGMSFRDKRRWHRQWRAETLGFGLAGMLGFVVPLANLLLGPALVTGGTLLVLELEETVATSPATG